MTRIHELGTDNANLIKLFEEYEKDIEDVKKILTVKGKSLSAALAEQPGWAAYYGMRKAELKSLVKYFEKLCAEAKASRYKHYTENYTRALGERVIGQYVAGDPVYTKVYELQIEVEELYEKFCEICEAFNIRGFALRDITAARVAEVHDLTIQ